MPLTGMSLAFTPGMEKSTVIVEQEDYAHVALLTLRRGVSAWGAWAFDAPDAGKSIQVGASAGCDWQIASPGVAPLTLLFTGESLLARCTKDDARIRLNGSALSVRWVSLQEGDLLELGPSCIEVHLAELATSLRSRSERRRKPQRGRTRARRAPPNVPKEPHVDTTAIVCQQEEPPPDWLPALFREPRRRSPTVSLSWYAVITVGILLAYLGWLALLDGL